MAQSKAGVSPRSLGGQRPAASQSSFTSDFGQLPFTLLGSSSPLQTRLRKVSGWCPVTQPYRPQPVSELRPSTSAFSMATRVVPGQSCKKLAAPLLDPSNPSVIWGLGLMIPIYRGRNYNLRSPVQAQAPDKPLPAPHSWATVLSLHSPGSPWGQ